MTLPLKRPMKGVAVDDLSKIRLPCYGMPKIDGFRCILGEYPLTSRLSRFPNEYFHRSLSGILPRGCFLDSEVVVGRRRGSGVLQRTSSGLTSQDGDPDFTLWVFDRPGIDEGWYGRYLSAQDLIGSVGHERIKLLKSRLITDRVELSDYLDEKLELGFEGIITRSLEGPYKEGKSTLREQYMLKIKPFDTAEGRIKGWFEEEANNNEAKREATGKLKRSSSKSGKTGKGTLGGFILVDEKSGVEVRVGGGFTKRQREELWKVAQHTPRVLVGALVRYKKQRVGEKDKPRHPGFVDFVDLRPEWDYLRD